jgi:hypothetical protein
MDKTSSIILIDKRNYRKIAQENWGLTDEQMVGMHVHHRIQRSQGGTNDPTNLYVCSPSFHKYIWHSGQEWIDWASKGGRLAVESSRRKRNTDPEWAAKEIERQKIAAKLSHQKRAQREDYSQTQKERSLYSHVIKRKHWNEETYDLIWEFYLRGIESGYLIGQQVKDPKWKKYHNMLKYAALGFSFDQLLDKKSYVQEMKRLEQSKIAHILDRYDD